MEIRERMITDMEHIKLQAGCLVVILYIAFIYYKERRRISDKKGINIFDGLLILSIVNLLLDASTAYFVNHQEQINSNLNLILHILFLISIDAFIFVLFLYMVAATGGVSRTKSKTLLLWSPFVVNVLVVVLSINSLEYRTGEISNYSMGVPAYTCFIMAGIYMILSLCIFFKRWNHIESRKRMSIFTYMMMLICVTIYQMLNPQALITSIGFTIIIIGIYLNQENPAIEKLSFYHKEMVMGFATLVENKDDNTGGHIRRTTMYVKLLSEELLKRGIYKDTLTKDYLNNLLLAAPMHDIGKIAVQDAILQKPGKLTDEEYEAMKKHTVSGGKIIKETFGHLGNEQYGKIAYEVARFHHEKWNGKGYPEGLKEEEIPLCARIMAIADVFDAVSQNRCYREAMPLEKCFSIISEGSGRDFEPVLAEVFLDIKDRVEEVHNHILEDK